MRHFVMAFLFLLCGLCGSIRAGAESTVVPDSASVAVSYARLPLVFQENQGELPTKAFFIARGLGYSLALATDEMSLYLQPSRNQREKRRGDVIQISIAGIAPDCRIDGLDELPGKANYFIGADPAKWHVGVRTFARVKYAGIYPGIDLIFYGKGQDLEYDLVLHPGADPARIHFVVSDQTEVALEKNGNLRLAIPDGMVRFRAPIIYQKTENGKKKNVNGQFKITAVGKRKELTFVVAPFDRSRTLVIDPVLDYSTYLGGSANDWAGAIAVDNAGNVYLAGTTASLDFPVTPNAVFPVNGGCANSCYDAFVAKINTVGKGLEYATYLGGRGDDFGNAIAIDANGNAYIAGTTNSTDFPTTADALQRGCGGTCSNNDAFVSKLNATGSALAYSTYLGGSAEDAGTGIAVRNGSAYVSGFSNSTDFPVTEGVYQTKMQGQGSSFVVELNTNASAETFGTFLGEVDLFDAGGNIVVDSSGNSYVAGTTLSANFPQTSGAFHTPFLPGLANNLYILKLNSTGKALAYSATLGGAGAGGITLDTSGNAYVSATAGPFSPITPGALDQPCDSGVLLLKLNATGTQLLTAAHVCPDSLSPVGIAIDASHNFIFGGSSATTDVPTTVGSLYPSKTSGCCFSDVVLGKLAANGSAIEYLTYFGGNSGDSPNGLAEDSSGNIYLAGYENSTNFPIKSGFQTANAGAGDAFLAKFTLPAANVSVWPARVNFPTQGIGIASSAADVTLANLSASSIEISSVLASENFEVSDNGCHSPLAAGAKCVIALSFNPRSSGNLTGALTITDGIGVQTVKLLGAGVSGPVVSFLPAYEITTASGVTSPPFPVTITNLGNEALTISQISLTGGPSFNFTGTTNCFRSIASRASCTIDVTFNGSGQSDAFLSITDNASGGSQATELIGNVVGSGLTFTATGLRFGHQAVGTTSSVQQVTLVNGTASAVTISNIKSTGTFSQTHTCTATLAAGAYCSINVSFKPSSAGIQQGTVTLSDSVSGSPLVLPLLGTGN